MRRLRDPAAELPTKRRLTSGCGTAAFFATRADRVESDFVVTTNDVFHLMEQLQEKSIAQFAVQGPMTITHPEQILFAFHGPLRVPREPALSRARSRCNSR